MVIKVSKDLCTYLCTSLVLAVWDAWCLEDGGFESGSLAIWLSGRGRVVRDLEGGCRYGRG